MELRNKILAILAVLCVIISACAVSAAEDVSGQGTDYLDDSNDGHGGLIIPPDNTHDEQRHAAGGDPYLDGSNDSQNGTIIPPDAAHDEAAMNQTNTTHAAGSDIVNTTNATHSAGSDAVNATNATATHTMPATGNPILALLAVCTLLGGYTVLRRK